MHILVTDDLYTNRLQVGILLKSLGHTFDEALNGEEAIARLHKTAYDLILMDIEMPVRNGIETTWYIRENFEEPKKNIPIIAITAHNPDDFFSDYKEHGFSGLISKPITAKKQNHVIHGLLNS